MLRIAAPFLLLMAAGCGRVIKRYPTPGAGSSATPTAASQVELPPGARCRPANAQPWDTLDPDAAADSCSGGPIGSPAWSVKQPPGLCYTLNAPCDGLEDHIAYLTFDDGPSDWTAAILDTLAAQDTRATFFVNARGLKGAKGLDGAYAAASGEQVPYRTLLKRTLVEGHALGNHTLEHPDLGTLSEDAVDAQLRDNERLVNVALVQSGAPTQPLSILRPPFGSPWFRGNLLLDDPELRRELVGRVFLRHGYNVLWNISSTDADEWAIGEASSQIELSRMRWQSTVQYADKVARIRATILEHALVQAGKGIVVLMHDSHNTTRDALPEIIAGLRARGYRFATLEDQAQKQYGRSSLELTPGPALTGRCAPEAARSCAFTPGGAVCGRFWEAFTAFGGDASLGQALSAPHRSSRGFLTQDFEHGSVELHPELEPPCDAVLSRP